MPPAYQLPGLMYLGYFCLLEIITDCDSTNACLTCQGGASLGPVVSGALGLSA